MDHPVKDIKAILKKLVQGTPQQQHDAFCAYFLPNSSFTCPMFRVPAFRDLKTYLPLPPPPRAARSEDGNPDDQDDEDEDDLDSSLLASVAASVSRLPVVNSRLLVQSLFRMSQLVLRASDLEIESAVYDQRAAVLTVHASRTVDPVFTPFRKKTRIRDVVILRLVQRTIDAQGRLLTPGLEGGAGGMDNNNGSSGNNNNNRNHHHHGNAVGVGGRTRLFVAAQETMMAPEELLKVFIPGVGGISWVMMQLFNAAVFLFMALLVLPVVGLVPEVVVRNGDHPAEEKEQVESG